MSSALPPRRSKRFQPLATPSRKNDDSVHCTWSGKPIYVRPTNKELDLFQEQHTVERDEDDEELETIFYQSFVMKREVITKFRGAGRAKGKGKNAADDTRVDKFSIGDTVLIETDTLYRMHRPPSVGVILAMWETKTRDSRLNECGSGPANMWVRVHWFLRPTELASIHAKRNHMKVCLNYNTFSYGFLILVSG